MGQRRGWGGWGGGESLRTAHQLDGGTRWRRLIGVCPPCASVDGGATCSDAEFRGKTHLVGMDGETGGGQMCRTQCLRTSRANSPMWRFGEV